MHAGPWPSSLRKSVTARADWPETIREEWVDPCRSPHLTRARRVTCTLFSTSHHHASATSNEQEDARQGGLEKATRAGDGQVPCDCAKTDGPVARWSLLNIQLPLGSALPGEYVRR